MEPPKRRKTFDDKLANLQVRDEEVLQSWQEQDEITCVECLKEKISDHATPDSGWISLKSDSFICCCVINIADSPEVTSSIKILQDLFVQNFCNSIEIAATKLSWILDRSNKLDRSFKLDSILSHFKTTVSDESVSESKMLHAISVLQDLCSDYCDDIDDKMC